MQSDDDLLNKVTRRDFLAASVGTALVLPQVASAAALAAAEAGPYLATGTRVGEVTDRSAIVWTRLTRSLCASVATTEVKLGRLPTLAIW